MASPATTQTVRPLDTLRFDTSGPSQITSVVADHLRLLGARTDHPAPGDASAAGTTVTGFTTLTGGGFDPAHATVTWADPASGLVDEATVQAATGVMAVHGRRDGSPRGLAVDYAATAAGVLTVQGLLASLVGQARGGAARAVTTGADRAGLLAVSQYLAAAGADEGEAAELAPGGPPFTSADGILFELETLDPGAWAAFWRALEAPAEALRAGWRPFQFRYATACAPFPAALHLTARSHTWERIRRAAAAYGAEVCALRPLAERAAEHDGAAPWALAPTVTGRLTARSHRLPGAAHSGGPLAGLTVLEAGRRIQAPLAAHLLGRLGADVIRIEPPGGDPLRGMPPPAPGSPRAGSPSTGASGPSRSTSRARPTGDGCGNWSPGPTSSCTTGRPARPPSSASTPRTSPASIPRSSTRTPAAGPTASRTPPWAPTSWCRPVRASARPSAPRERPRRPR